MADEFHARFRDVVLKARPNVEGELESTFDGRVFTAKQAKELQLIDQIGYLDNAVAIARPWRVLIMRMRCFITAVRIRPCRSIPSLRTCHCRRVLFRSMSPVWIVPNCRAFFTCGKWNLPAKSCW